MADQSTSWRVLQTQTVLSTTPLTITQLEYNCDKVDVTQRFAYCDCHIFTILKCKTNQGVVTGQNVMAFYHE